MARQTYLFVPRNFNLDEETDFKTRVATNMSSFDGARTVQNFEKTKVIGWIIEYNALAEN